MAARRLLRHISGGLANVQSDLKQHLKSGLEDFDEAGSEQTPDLVLVMRRQGLPQPVSPTASSAGRGSHGHVPRIISRKTVDVPPEGTDPGAWLSDLVHLPAEAEAAALRAVQAGANLEEVAATAKRAVEEAASAAVPSEMRELREAATIMSELAELAPSCDLTTPDGTLTMAKEVLKRIFGEDRFEVSEHPLCGDLIAVTFRWKEDRLLEFAEEVGYPVQIEPARLKDMGIELDAPSAGYMPFRRAVQGFARLWPSDDGLLPGQGDGWQVLQSIHRQRLMWQFALRWLKLHVWMRKQYIYDVVFPHCEWRLHRLRNFCERQTICEMSMPGSLDVDPIRNYFGGHYALYFAFSEYTYRWALLLFITATCFNIAEVCFKSEDNFVVINLRMLFSVFLAFVGTLFIELWARESNYWMARWGSITDNSAKAHEHKVICTQFEGTKRPADWDQSQLITVPHPGRRCRGLFIAISIEVVFIVLVFMLVFGPYAYCIRHPSIRKHKGILNGAMSLLCQGIKVVWKNLAPALVPLEQHKFRHAADESVDRKTTIVNFVCLFAPLFYLVFVLPLAGWCTGEEALDADGASSAGCVDKEEYRVDLQAALLTQLISEAMLCTKDVAIPIFFLVKRTLLEDNDMGQSSNMEREFLLSEYDGYYLAQDYQQLLFPMAFVLLFGSLSRSLTTGTWLFLAWSQRKLDLWKLLHLYRRPMPVEVGDSGRSRAIFIRSISFFSGACNWAQIVESYPMFSNLVLEERIMVFLAGMYIITILKNIVSATVPGKGKRTRLLEVRGDWQRLRVDAFFNAHQSGTAKQGSGWEGDEPSKAASAAMMKLDRLREQQKRLQLLRAETASLDADGWRKQRRRVAQEVAAFERAVAELEAVVPKRTNLSTR